MKNTFLKLFVLTAVLSLAGCEGEDINSQKYSLEESNSSIEWKGYGPNQFHDGSFAVKGQDIEVEDGLLKSGIFTIPIVSIQNFDLPEDVKPVLLNHLKSADFFNMAMYPNAIFKITKVEPATNPSAEHIYTVTGDFTMLGQTHSINFPALIKIEGKDLEIDADFELDRTKWGMTYAADPALGEHHILPEVDIKLDIEATNE